MFARYIRTCILIFFFVIATIITKRILELPALCTMYTTDLHTYVHTFICLEQLLLDALYLFVRKELFEPLTGA